MRLTRRGIENIRRGLKRSWEEGGSHDLKFRHGETDADTLRKRALSDRRGTHYATIQIPTEIGLETFRAEWSVGGRTDQLDVRNAAGAAVLRCRPSLVLDRLFALVN